MPKLLIVDDSMFQRFNLAKLAGEEGFTVLEAKNGEEALAQVEAEAPDALLLDLNMPDMNGIEVLQTLADRGGALRVLVVTADIQDTTKARCKELGVIGFLNKPVDETFLREELRTIKALTA